jgi:hypothetical protein
MAEDGLGAHASSSTGRWHSSWRGAPSVSRGPIGVAQMPRQPDFSSPGAKPYPVLHARGRFIPAILHAWPG